MNGAHTNPSPRAFSAVPPHSQIPALGLLGSSSAAWLPVSAQYGLKKYGAPGIASPWLQHAGSLGGAGSQHYFAQFILQV